MGGIVKEITDEDLRKAIMDEVELLLKKEREMILKRAHQRLKEKSRSGDQEKLS